MSLFSKAKHAAQEFKTNWDASAKRMDEDADRRKAPPKPAKPSKADQQQIQRDAETVIRNQQMGLTD